MPGGLDISALFASTGSFSLASSNSPPPEEVGRASLLLLIFALLMGILLLAIALLTVIRRRRTRSTRPIPKPAKPLANPWQESANRVRVNPLPRDEPNGFSDD